jgi:hypothetical protein
MEEFLGAHSVPFVVLVLQKFADDIHAEDLGLNKPQ